MRRMRRKSQEKSLEPLGLSPQKLMKRIKPIQSHNEYLKGLIYGRSGTGKTTLASTLVEILTPPRDRVLLLDLREKGTDSVADVENLDVLEVLDWNTFEGVYWFLKEGEHPYGGVIIDTATRLQGIAMTQAKEASNLANSDIMDRLAWNHLGSMLGPRLLDIRDLPMHVIFIAQNRRRENDEDMVEEMDLLPEVGPDLMPSIAKELNTMCGLIGHTFIRQRTVTSKKGGKSRKVTDFCLRLGPHPLFLTKVRAPKRIKIPKYIVDPSLEKIRSAIKGEENG